MAVYGHLDRITAERQALALEGIEDLLRRAIPPALNTEGQPFSIVKHEDGIVTIHGFDVTVTMTLDEGGITSLQGAAEDMVRRLNSAWGEYR